MDSSKRKWETLIPSMPLTSPANISYPQRDGPATNLLTIVDNFKKAECTDLRALLLNVANVNDLWTILAESLYKELGTLSLVMCDSDVYMLARHFVLMYIALNINPSKDDDIQFLWAVWLDAYLKEEHYQRLTVVLGILMKDTVIKRWNFAMRSSATDRLQSVYKQWVQYTRMPLDMYQTHIEQNNETFYHCYNIPNPGDSDEVKDSNIKAAVHTSALNATASSVETLLGQNPLAIGKFVEDAHQHFCTGCSFPKKSISKINPTYLSQGYHWHNTSHLHYTAFTFNTIFANFAPIQLSHDANDKWSPFHDCFQLLKHLISKLQDSLSHHRGCVNIAVHNKHALELCRSLAEENAGNPSPQFDVINTYLLADSCGLLNVLLCCLPLIKPGGTVFSQSTYLGSPVSYALEMLCLTQMSSCSTFFGYDLDELYSLPRHVMLSAGYQQFRWVRISDTGISTLSSGAKNFIVESFQLMQACFFDVLASDGYSSNAMNTPFTIALYLQSLAQRYDLATERVYDLLLRLIDAWDKLKGDETRDDSSLPSVGYSAEKRNDMARSVSPYLVMLFGSKLLPKEENVEVTLKLPFEFLDLENEDRQYAYGFNFRPIPGITFCLMNEKFGNDENAVPFRVSNFHFNVTEDDADITFYVSKQQWASVDALPYIELKLELRTRKIIHTRPNVVERKQFNVEPCRFSRKSLHAAADKRECRYPVKNITEHLGHINIELLSRNIRNIHVVSADFWSSTEFKVQWENKKNLKTNAMEFKFPCAVILHSDLIEVFKAHANGHEFTVIVLLKDPYFKCLYLTDPGLVNMLKLSQPRATSSKKGIFKKFLQQSLDSLLFRGLMLTNYPALGVQQILAKVAIDLISNKPMECQLYHNTPLKDTLTTCKLDNNTMLLGRQLHLRLLNFHDVCNTLYIAVEFHLDIMPVYWCSVYNKKASEKTPLRSVITTVNAMQALLKVLLYHSSTKVPREHVVKRLLARESFRSYIPLQDALVAYDLNKMYLSCSFDTVLPIFQVNDVATMKATRQKMLEKAASANLFLPCSLGKPGQQCSCKKGITEEKMKEQQQKVGQKPQTNEK